MELKIRKKTIKHLGENLGGRFIFHILGHERTKKA